MCVCVGPHRASAEDVQEPLNALVAADGVAIAAGGQVEQHLLDQAAVLDLKRRHVRLRHDARDLHKALHTLIHLPSTQKESTPTD